MGLSCGVVLVILRLAVLIQYRSVTDTHTHTHRHTRTAYTALSKASRGKNVSHDVTTPLSGTVCRPSAGTSYDQPVHKIWSLYVNSLRRYERRRQMQKLECFGELWVTQGHRKHRHLIECDFLFDFNRNYTSILYRFRFIACFSSKVTNFNPPHLHLSPL